MEWTIGLISAAGSVFVTLTITYLFNYFVGLPKKYREAREAEQRERERVAEENRCRDQRLADLEAAVNKLPEYRAQSLRIQDELRATDRHILDACVAIKEDVVQNRQAVLEKLERLEQREKNALRSKILEEYRLYTDESRNPMLAWSEMEAHSFHKLVEDYEALGGNDYVHSTVLPDIYRLEVIRMSDLNRLKELYQSRRVR